VIASPSPQVLIVGGGLAGLSAAHRLQTFGARVTVLEAEPQLGGRLRCDTLAGFTFEPMPHALPQSCPDLFGLVRELGLSSTVRRTSLERVLELRHGAVRVLDTDWRVAVGDGLWVPGLGALRERRVRDLISWLGDRLNPRLPEADTRLDDRSVADFARLYLDSTIDARLFDPLLEVHFGLASAHTSRLLLFQLLDSWGKPRVVQSFELCDVPVRLAAQITDVRTGLRVESVAPNGRAVRLESGKLLEVDAVVLATPATEVLKLVPELSPVEQAFFESATYAQRTSLAVVLEGPLNIPIPTVWVAAPGGKNGSPLSAIMDLTPWQKGPAPSGLSLVLLCARSAFTEAHRAASDDEIANVLLEQAESFQPGFRRRVRAPRLNREAQATPCFGVGRYRQIARFREERQRRESRKGLFFCGDYLVGPHLEAAVSSGLRAARDVITSFNESRSLS
jgi:oxygen-dependent protoporphyrinogen oxidase